MSDQPATPPKPKPGSLRDRIAAFEKSATTAPAPAPAPAPRPKPAGFATWKPKVPSPPDSPSASSATAPTEHAGSSSAAKVGGMSASDAKESITKAGSLKDRMAALQGKGAFGAPPPLAPKPATDKPKWKPPPVVHAPVDADDHAADASAPAAIAAAVERTLSPPTSVKSQESVGTPKVEHGEAIDEAAAHEGGAAAPVAEGDNGVEGEAAPVDPEEEERQRRAAIAARMARLGGARVGMAPPVFGKKPVRRPTQEEAHITQEAKPVEESPRSEPVSSPEAKPVEELSPPQITSPIQFASPPSAVRTPVISGIQPDEDIPQLPESTLSVPTADIDAVISAESAAESEAESRSSKGPISMPVPAVPRRAGPPRKKPSKPAAPPPEAPEKLTPVPSEVEEIKEAPAVEPESRPEIVELEEELEDNVIPPSMEPASVSSILEESLPHPEQEHAADGLKRRSSEAKSISSQNLFTNLPGRGGPDTSGFVSPPPSSALTEDEYSDAGISEEMAPLHHHSFETLATVPSAGSSEIEGVDILLAQTHMDALNEEEEREEDLATEEEERKKRVAERIAKMGGFNPLAPPPPPPQRALSSDSTQTQQALTPGAATSPPPPTPSVPALHHETKEESSHPAPPTQVHHPETQIVEESKVAEEPSDEIEDVDDEDDASNYEPAIPRKSIEHTEGFAREPTRRSSNEPQPVQVGHVSRAPPITLSGTRPAMQVQQFRDIDNEEEQRLELLPARRDSDSAQHSSSLHVQAPRRLIPQAPEEDEAAEEDEATDEEADERLAQSQLFVPPPGHHAAIAHPRRQFSREEEDDGNESDNTPPLPHLQRRSVEVPPPPRSPSPLSDYDLQPDSDHDGKALPIPPRHVGGHVPPARSAPPPPPPPPQEDRYESEPENKPVPVRHISHRKESSGPTSPPLLTRTFSESGSEEILDEEEGDPIDPGFHSPSRRTSAINLHMPSQSEAAPSGTRTSLPAQPSASVSPPPPPPHAPPAAAAPSSVEEKGEHEEDSEQVRRRTIAERMAKLGGIKFGAAPPPMPVSRPPPPPPQDSEHEEGAGEAEEEEKPEVLSEEEEERARKERIAAKMAQMGGMRIGMMPMGMGSLPPQPSHVLRGESAHTSPPLAHKQPPVVPKSPPLPSSSPPTRAIPPSRPPPPPTQLPPQAQDVDSDSDYGSPPPSDDGVKVEAEESELEEVSYEHVQEEPEERPPPVPSRSSRRMSQRQDSYEQPAAVPPHHPRPPVPTANPNRRSSVQTTRSATGSSAGETVHNAPARKSSGFTPAGQSEYVMVEEPEEVSPPLPPARPTTRAPPARRTSQAPQAPQAPPTTARQGTDPSDSISSQWELPSIPMSTIDFGAGADLSLSWTDAANEPVPTSPLPPKPPAKKPSAPSEIHLTPDDLIALWGRVGVQVCEVATSMFEKSKKTLIGDGTYAGFVQAVLAAVPNAAPVPTPTGEWGYLVYVQNGPSVQKRTSEIMPGDIVEIQDAKLKGHKGLQTYHQNVGGAGEILVGVVGEFEAKKAKIRVFQANQHVGQQTVESVSYRLEDLKSGIVKVYRVLEA